MTVLSSFAFHLDLYPYILYMYVHNTVIQPILMGDTYKKTQIWTWDNGHNIKQECGISPFFGCTLSKLCLQINYALILKQKCLGCRILYWFRFFLF